MNLAITTHGKHEASLETHHGKIVGITTGKLVIQSGHAPEESFAMVHDLLVTHAGKPCTFDDLRLGEYVRITTRKDNEHEAIVVDRVEHVE